MTSQSIIRDFLAQRTLAIAGVSRNEKKFGNAALKSLKAKGYRMMILHPIADELEGQPCYRSIRDLPEPADGLVLVVPPARTEALVKEAFDAGIRRVWMQTGAASPEAVAFCAGHGMELVHNECILMFAEPMEFFHRAHRFIHKLTGRLPR